MSETDIAVIGISIRVPGASDVEQLWDNLRKGVISLRRYDEAALRAAGVNPSLLAHPQYIPVAATLPDADLFDPVFFGLSQREADIIDPQHRLLLECAWELLDRIGYGEPTNRPTVGIFAGAAMNTYLSNILKARCDLMSLSGMELMLANDKDYLTARVSYKLGLTGPSVVVQTGCSTSLVAIHMATQSLLAGECDIALAGGVAVDAKSRPGYFYEPGLMFSPDGMCRAFDEHAAGTIFSDGVGLVALRRVDEAVADGDHIHAVVRGSATNNDGSRKAGFTAPSIEGQRALIEEALLVAGEEPDALGYIEAHGTATPLGDPAEFAALCEAIGSRATARRFCALGTIKANLGHLAAAAGVAGFVKAVLAVEHGEVPPHPAFSRAHPYIPLEASPFIINTEPIAWPGNRRRVAGVTSLSMGGSNAHVVVAEAPPERQRRRAMGWQAVPLSAQSYEALHLLTEGLSKQLQRQPAFEAGDIGFTLQTGRAAFLNRRVVFGRDTAELTDALSNSSPPDAIAGQALPGARLVMLIDEGDGFHLAEHALIEAEVRRRLEIVRNRFGLDLTKEEIASAATERQDTAHGAVALLIALDASITVWLRFVPMPVQVLSKGVGDLAVACAFGWLSIEDAVGLLLGMPVVTRDSRRDEALAPGVRWWSWSRGVISSPVARDVEWWRSGADGDEDAATRNWRCQPDDVLLSLGGRGALFEHARAATACAGATPIIEPASVTNRTQVEPLLRTLGELWCRGISVRWSAASDQGEPRRVPLPGHPLQRRRCWVEKETPAAAPGDSETSRESHANTVHSDPDSWLYIETWKRGAAHATKTGRTLQSPVLVYEDAEGLSAALAHSLRSDGVRVVTVRPGPTGSRGDSYQVDPASTGSSERLVRELLADGFSPRHVLHLWGFGAHACATDEHLNRGLFTLFEIAKAFNGRPEPVDIHVIGDRIFDVLGGEPVDAARSTVMGAVRVLPQEVAGLRCHCIDIGAADGTSIVERAGALLSLLADSTPATVMALRGGYWWQQHFERSEARPPIEIRREGVYIVTGGLGHVGSVLAEELGRTYGVRPVLIDRTPIPPEENHADILAREGSSGPLGARLNRLRKLERAGIEFLTIAADVTSMDEMEAVASRARARFGRLDGFIHAAGASGAGAMLSIAETSRADWWRVLAPKLLGAQVLHELFEGQNLELGCFVSSLSGIAGGANYGAYAAANRFLDGFVQQHRGKRHYLAIDWEGWAGWDAPAAEKTGAKSQLVPSSWALSDDEAAAAFKLGLPFIAEGRVAVSRVPLETRIRAAAHSHVTDTVVPVQATPEEAATSYEQKLVSLWGEVLGRPVDDLHANFFDLGGDSLLAGDLAARIAESFGVWLSVTTILEVPTIAGLAARLAGTETDEEFARSSRRHRARLQAMRRNDYNDVLRPTE